MLSYNIHGKRVSLKELANDYRKKVEQIGNAFLNDKKSDKFEPYDNNNNNNNNNNNGNSNNNLKFNLPWELELLRYLFFGGRKLSNPKWFKTKRSIQSAGERLFYEYYDEIERNCNKLLNENDLTNTNTNQNYDFDEISLNPDANFTRINSLSNHNLLIKEKLDNDINQINNYLNQISLDNNLNNLNLRVTLSDIIQKIEDNEGMDIHNYTDAKYIKKKTRTIQNEQIMNSDHDSVTDSLSTNSNKESIDSIDHNTKFSGHKLNHKVHPSEIFRNILLTGLLIRTTLNIIRPIHEEKLKNRKAKTFIELQREYEVKFSSDQLGFDKFAYKAKRDKSLTHEAVNILTMPSKYRTSEMICSALVAVTATTEAFSEFPFTMRNAIISKAWYEKYESRRMIIRQGQPPLNFYYIISGSVVVSVSRKDKQTGEPFEESVAFLKAGQSFGELALIYGGKRSASIISQTSVELLVMSRDEFECIFMQKSMDHEAEHITYLRTISFMPKEVIDQLDGANSSIILFTFFRRNMTICLDSNQSKWIYVIKTGQCRIIKDVYLHESKIKSRINSCKSNMSKTSRPTTRNQYHFNFVKSKHTILKSNTTTISTTTKSSNTNQFNQTNKAFTDQQNEPKHSPRKVFIELKRLESDSVFGLESIVFQPFGGTTSVSLVSDGAECVVISKEFFLKHCSTTFLNYLRRKVQPFPTEKDLEVKLNNYRDWRIYRDQVIENCVLSLNE